MPFANNAHFKVKFCTFYFSLSLSPLFQISLKTHVLGHQIINRKTETLPQAIAIFLSVLCSDLLKTSNMVGQPFIY
jgi:hypothetical protein